MPLRISIVILSVFVLSACKQKQISSNNEQPNDLRLTYGPILKGAWVLTDYIDELHNTGSPFIASNKLSGLVTLAFPAQLVADSFVVGASLNNHEGSSFSCYFDKDTKGNRLPTNIVDYENDANYYELGFEIVHSDTFLFLYHFSKNKMLIDKRSFTKVSDKYTHDDLGWPIQNIVNEILFKGEYVIFGNSDTIPNVVFTVDGHIKGCKFTAYDVQTDYVGPTKFNCISLKGVNFNRDYAFNINADTIFLFSISGYEDEGTSQIDTLEYTLIRK